MKQALAGIKGVRNITEDVVVHGKNKADHDQNLENLITRLEKINLTLNAEKYSFRMSGVVFMGLLLSKYGVDSSSERVRAVVEATPPTSASEIEAICLHREMGFKVPTL